MGAGAGEARRLCAPIRRRGKLRYIRDALRGRASRIPLRCPLAHRHGIAIPGPFGSANRAASSKPARFFRRWRRFAAFLFPTATALLGCGGVPLSAEKENAPFDGVREKGSGGGIPGFARNARGACYRGFSPALIDGFCPFNHIWQLRKLGSRPDALPFSFCCRSPVVAED